VGTEVAVVVGTEVAGVVGAEVAVVVEKFRALGKGILRLRMVLFGMVYYVCVWFYSEWYGLRMVLFGMV
jgi:hypothetical protein